MEVKSQKPGRSKLPVKAEIAINLITKKVWGFKLRLLVGWLWVSVATNYTYRFYEPLMKSCSHSLMLYGNIAASWNIFQAESHHHDNTGERRAKKKFFLVGK